MPPPLLARELFAASRNQEENTEFQYAVDRQEEKSFRLVDHGRSRSKSRGAGPMHGAAFELLAVFRNCGVL